jgi:transposase-like protein
MKRKRFSVEQIVAVLKQLEVGVPVAELIRQVGISEQTLYRWKKQYKGLEDGPDTPVQAVAGRKRPAEASGGGADAG